MPNLKDRVAVVTGASRGAGRGIALAADSNVMEKSGRVLTAGDLAREYGFTDVDGRLIPPFKMPDGYPYQ
jgi:NAD(P)-dependent dehydrogenase (short-subunit alcohol dehydrogenase family)